MNEENEREIRTDGGQVVNQKVHGIRKEEVRATLRMM